ncbi:hypothetical protein PMI18_00878 [Pseudomonas sp. GM102]|nr:hypothetical protein PMI18_00878 [Pseudomonas sp. GM102]
MPLDQIIGHVDAFCILWGLGILVWIDAKDYL